MASRGFRKGSRGLDEYCSINLGSSAMVFRSRPIMFTSTAQSASNASRAFFHSFELICPSLCLRAITEWTSAKLTTEVKTSWSGSYGFDVKKRTYLDNAVMKTDDCWRQ